jgi:hypothetical protein
MERLKPGDIVVRSTGWTPMEIIWTNGYNMLKARYCGSDYPENDVTGSQSNFRLITDMAQVAKCPGFATRLTPRQHEKLQSQLVTKGHQTMSKPLYQTKEETPRFGTKLAVNSKGQIVLELKGSGGVEAFDTDAVEVVMPYTVDVNFIGDAASKTYSFLSKEGDVAVGDLLLADGYATLMRVMAVATRSTSATVELKGVKVPVVPFG